ncbi:FAD:protein FMN transferase [Sporolactobacillus shoreae]|uniref:FAD:protein FMN transferase n=1 Tax=Sporolactobacillus shoreae TaxID=1465501 RepID=A0A4Z0GIR1_9BACL|nr:FAD:protein FMN transferase [Sporolactobacillus shoreae]
MAVFRSRAMNTEILNSGLSASDCKNVFDWFQAVEARFSRFLPESELSRINSHAGDATRLSEPFAELLFEALRYTEETGGLFHPFLGSVINHLGYNQSFEKIYSSEIPVLHFLENESKQAEPVQFDLERRILKISKKELLDFGGIAKGWGVQKITLDLIRKKRTSGLVDAGGDLMA